MSLKMSLKKVFELFVFLYAFFLASRPLSDGDFWWHLKTGEYILQNRAIPRVDFYSFTNVGKPWVAHEWLSEVIFYQVYSHLGFNALIFIFGVLGALAFWIVYRRCHAHPYIGLVASLLGMASILTTVGVRPRTFTLLFASIYLLMLTRYAREGKRGGLWWLIPLMALWVNLHAGFLIGLVLIAVTLVGIPLDSLAQGERLTSGWSRIKKLLWLLIGCTLAVNLNPQGPRIFLFPFEFFLSPIQQNTVHDWLSPNFHDPEMLPVAVLILLTTAAMALSPTRVRPSELLLFLSTLYATLKSNRHVAIFALVAAPLLANYLQIWIESVRLQKHFDMKRAETPTRLGLLFGIVLLIPIVALAAKLKSEVYGQFTQRQLTVPLDAVRELKEKGITGNTFTDPNIWGGYFIWAMPTNPVYIDGRIDMYGDEFVNDYIKLVSGLVDCKQSFDRYGVRVAVLSQNSVIKLELQRSSEWRKIFEDDMAVVFVRQ